ncbi:MAG: MBL fold metallo-hydrolase [Geminicoccaceae bacterium]|nr:MBL fold metallo-hydrolase [Geminicoccaceae bacterium]MCS7269049.1 MBL fold metallo-hydrolase [Geminicoccaceae bacterium]MCX7629122.1 MBL fold metallo-hydrolase [Geminicoccaceae bacterium]MDW8124866.1 MBL fold metallo-hydrolase [Geminicoccaceae bacterium]MDW8342385.1 MBL fold metallo-hydrolase [Geminicoccaceae bacterium]
MRSAFDVQLVNGPTGDPALYADVIGAGRAILVDLGDLSPLPPRKLLRVSDVLLSHAHLDHFAGFERLLRVLLGREKLVRLAGPAGTIERLVARLASYEWNLAEDYREAVSFEVVEIHEGRKRRRARLNLRERFVPRTVEEFESEPGLVRAEARLVIRAAVLDHGVPSLAFALEEPLHVQVFRNALDAMGLGTGPWLRLAKDLVLENAPDETPVRARWYDGTRLHERTVRLGELRWQALRLVPGQRVVYVTDCAWTKSNLERILELARGADTLVIEAPFSDADRAQARARRHLTAREAGTIARLAGVRRMIPFHFSPRYEGRFALLEAEARAAFEGRADDLVLPECM